MTNTKSTTVATQTSVVETTKSEVASENTQTFQNEALPKLITLASEVTGLGMLELVQVYTWAKQDGNLAVLMGRLQNPTTWEDFWVGCPVQPKQELLVVGVTSKLKELAELARPWIGDAAALFIMDKIDTVNLDAVKEDVAIGVSLVAGKAVDAIATVPVKEKVSETKVPSSIIKLAGFFGV